MRNVSWVPNVKTNQKNLAWSKSNKIQGLVTFNQEPDGIMVRVDIRGLEPNTEHGFHIHEKRFASVAELTGVQNCCDLLGGHFNPGNKQHGSMWNSDRKDRHVGDLCNNLLADNTGRVRIAYLDELISLDKNNPNYIGNRSLVIHQYPDDLGRQGFQGVNYTKMTDELLRWYGRTDKEGKVKDRKELMRKSQIDGNAGTRIACGNIIT
jgi:Cu-Zn family superoxide dismutase